MFTKDAAHELFVDREPIPRPVLSAAAMAFPWLPPSYWAFVEQIGHGDFGGIAFSAGPFPLDELMQGEGPEGFVSFGHDTGGMFYGFHPSSDGVCGVDSADPRMRVFGLTFEEFIRQMMAAFDAG